HLYANASGPLSSTTVALPVVLTAGLADGINPCAFTVLLLYVAPVGSLYGNVADANRWEVRRRLFSLGGAFIVALFLTYLALGVGIFRASTIFAENHIGARSGAMVSVFLGLWMLKDALTPDWGPVLRAPAVLGRLLDAWGRRASVGAMLGLGALVGLCTVPCSGAVYVAILSLLALQQSFMKSYAYLVLYNVMFVLPLVAILLVASTRPMLNRLAHWNLHHQERVRLALGSGVVTLGLLILATV
ncbi:MAG: hypothetical protein HY681_11210, partial [Chloroflexi bacterium]|nr:hypothetical protein [Chloroflexota bacterium]